MKSKLLEICNKTIEISVLSILILPVIFYCRITQDMFVLPKETIFHLLVIITLFFWSVKIFIEREVTLVNTGLNYFVLGYFGIGLFSILWSTNFHISITTLNKQFFYMLAYFIAANLIRNEKQVRLTINILMLIVGLEAVYGILQYYNLDPIFRFKLTEKLRILGTFGYHNYFSEYLVLVLPLIIVVFFSCTSSFKKIFTGLVILFSIYVLILTKTRGAWLGFVGSIFFMLFLLGKARSQLFLKYKKQILITLVLTAVLVSSGLLISKEYSKIIKRITSTIKFEDESIVSRFVMWETAVEMVKEKPVLGFGIGTFKFHYLDYVTKILKRKSKPTYINEEAEDVHNEYLQSWVETGLLGLVAFILLIGCYFKINMSSFRVGSSRVGSSRKKTGYNSDLSIGLISGVLGLLIDALVNFPLHVVPIAITFWYILGFTVALGNMSEKGISINCSGPD